MTYAISLSPCSRYVMYRPGVITESLEDAFRRSAKVVSFAEQHGTHRVLLDWRNHSFPVNNRFSDTLVKFRHLLAKGAWRIALVYSMDSEPYSIEMITGFAQILNAIGQGAGHFVDYDEAVEWLVSD